MKQRGGYTIIETMIAIALFLVVVTAGMSALLSANVVHNKSQDLRSIMDNLSFVLEDMSRNLRTGYNYHCGTTASESPLSCAGGSTIFFESSTGASGNTGDQWGYKVESTDGGKTFNISKTTNGGSSWTQLNAVELTMNGAVSPFSVLGAEAPSSGNHQQPYVTIRLAGSITYKNVVTPFSLETSISQRLIDQ